MTVRRRVNIASLRKGRHVLMLTGDGNEVSSEDLDECLPMEVVKIDRTTEAPDAVLLQCRSYVSGQDHGLGRFDAATVAYLATAEDMKRADLRRDADDEDEEEAPTPPLPAGWPSFPRGEKL